MAFLHLPRHCPPRPGSRNRRTGLRSERADLTAWDSVEGHPTALPALKNVMCTPRQKRRTESLRVPHRHGILHGRDLGFANQLVAAKCWGALFALGEWARKVE